MNQKVKDYIALTVMGVFCILTILGQIEAMAFVGLATYVAKKYFDENKKEAQ